MRNSIIIACSLFAISGAVIAQGNGQNTSGQNGQNGQQTTDSTKPHDKAKHAGDKDHDKKGDQKDGQQPGSNDSGEHK